VKTSGVGGPRGFDSGKQVNGRKRHLVVDTEGFVLRAVVHAATIRDRDGVKLVLHESITRDFPRRRHVWLDAAYNGKGKGKDWIEQTLGWSAQIVQHPPRYQKVWVPKDLPPSRSIGPSTCRRRASGSSRAAGWWKERSLGKASSADRARSTNACAPPARRGST
jgi:hypothetical protein